MPIIKLTLAATASLLLYGLYKVASRLLHPYFSSLKHLPGPDSSSFIYGNVKELRDIEKSTLFEDWTRKYGKVMKIHLLFGKECILSLDTRAINHVLTHSMDYERPEEGRKGLARVVGNGVLVTAGDKHRQQRRVMNPSFAPASIKALTPIFFQKTLQLRDVFFKLISDNPSEPIEVLSWLSRTTLDVIGLAGFNYQFDALSANKKPNELNQAFSTLMHASSSVGYLDVLQAYLPFLRSLPTTRERERRKAMRTMNRIGHELVDERKRAVLGEKQEIGKAEDNRGDLVGRDLLSALVQSNMDTELPDNQRMHDEDVLAQVPTFIVAGHETTSTETMWALFALAQTPDVQRKLREEVRAVPTDTLEMDDLNALPYLDMVVRETLRLHAAVPAVSRVATKDDVIPLDQPFTDRVGEVHNEIRVKKGDRVIVPILALNVLKSIWGEDALEFRPERWLRTPDAATHIPGVWGHIMTFLGGARGCIGYRFALIEMKALLFTLLRNFEFEMSVPAEYFEKRAFIVTRPYLKSDPKAGAQMPLIVKAYRGH